jgi:protease IV
MKQFFKYVFASMLGTFVALILALFIFLFIISAIVASADNKRILIAGNSVLHLKLDHPIHERTGHNSLRSFSLSGLLYEAPGLNEILAGIKKAKEDNNIKGIYLEISHVPAGLATIEEIREALGEFRASGKFVIAYGEFFSQTAYYLATAADHLFLNPSGGIDFKGLRAEMTFYKGTFDKLGIEPQIIRHGKFKSAVEPYVSEQMSTENREQLSSLLSANWQVLLSNISRARKISGTRLQEIADSMIAGRADIALRYGLADTLFYKDEVLAFMRRKLHLPQDAEISFTTLRKYRHVILPSKEKGLIREKIAVIYAYGEVGIRDVIDEDNSIDPEKLSEAFTKARNDKNVKAVVLRVNSPGGSALHSDIILRELALTQKVKPVIASFGDYAASGGYYIACKAQKIVAQPTTITGSIGIFAVLFNFRKMLNEKLGVTVDTVKTARYADHGSMLRSFTNAEKAILQLQVEKLYADFIGHVAEGRKMTRELVDSIAQGRAWSGTEAKNIGLVDEFGGTARAIELAAEAAGISKYRIVELPEQKESFRRLLEGFTEEVKAGILQENLKKTYQVYSRMENLLNAQGIQALLPYRIDIY